MEEGDAWEIVEKWRGTFLVLCGDINVDPKLTESTQGVCDSWGRLDMIVCPLLVFAYNPE